MEYHANHEQSSDGYGHWRISECDKYAENLQRGRGSHKQEELQNLTNAFRFQRCRENQILEIVKILSKAFHRLPTLSASIGYRKRWGRVPDLARDGSRFLHGADIRLLRMCDRSMEQFPALTR